MKKLKTYIANSSSGDGTLLGVCYVNAPNENAAFEQASTIFTNENINWEFIEISEIHNTSENKDYE